MNGESVKCGTSSRGLISMYEGPKEKDIKSEKKF